MRINLPAVGQSYNHSDLPLSAQVTSNWFPEINNETTRNVTLQPFPGATLFATVGTGDDRGMTEWNGTIYKVTGDSLYSVSASGSSNKIGAIYGTGRCTFPASSYFLVIVSSGRVYRYNGNVLTENTDSDLESPDYGAYLNNQWIYQGAEARFCVSDAGLPGSINALNYASAESDGDALIRPYTYNQLLYLFGEKTIETWYNSGTGSPPFDRVQGGILQKGLGAADSVSHNDDYIYFLGDDRFVYQMRGIQAQVISSIPMSRAFQEYGGVSDGIGFCYSILGQRFYQLNVAGKTWVYNESSGGWFELTIRNTQTPYPATSYLYSNGEHLIAEGGKILRLDTSSGLYNGLPMVRERITGLISGELLGQDFIGSRLFMSRCEIIIKGSPPLGDAPQIMLSWSDDAGYTWSNERIIDCGELGNYTFKAVAHQLGMFCERVLKIRISDESTYSLHRVSGDIDVGN